MNALEEVVGDKGSVSLYDYFSAYPENARDLSFLVREPFILVLKEKDSSRKVKLIADCRFDERLSAVTRAAYHVVLNSRHQLWTIRRMGSRLPPLQVHNANQFRPLWEILGLEKVAENPKSLAELKLFFIHSALPRDLLVKVYIFSFSFLGKNATYSNELHFGNESAKVKITILARPGQNYDLVYKEIRKKTAKSSPRPKKNSNQSFHPKLAPPSPFSRNRSCGMKIFCKALNLALDLGLVTPLEMGEISNQLGRTAAFLVCQNDESDNLRNLMYMDLDSLPCFVEVDSSEETTEIMNSFYKNVFDRRNLLAKKREAILAPLLGKLSQVNCLESSLYLNCQKQLKECIKRQFVVLYCTTDIDLHNLKYGFGKYMLNSSKQRLCRVELQMDAANSLVALKTGMFCILNLAAYIDSRKNAEFLKALETGSKIGRGPRSQEACLKGAEDLAARVLQMWQKLGYFFLDLFDFDVYSIPLQSLSCLSLQAVHSKIASLEGPFGRAIEKLKPYYNEILRNYSRGGFLYSATRTFAYGQPLDIGATRLAKCAVEYDINSSYGFIASTASLPGGFGVGYLNAELRNPVMPGAQKHSNAEPPDLLVQMDGNRCLSFEFRAVYYTLWKIEEAVSQDTQDPRGNIRSVYSNFHAKGIFQIKKCILDLVVVYQDGSLQLFNFDSIFSHACDSCPLIGAYVSNLPHHVLRMKALRRDATINDWVRQRGLPSATYSVLTDCHHKEYSVARLRAAFRNIPALKSLKQIFPNQARLSTAEMVAWLKSKVCWRNFTYLVLARGRNVAGTPVTPILTYPKGGLKSGQRLCTETGQENVLFSRDYFEHLLTEHSFVVDRIDMVLFFAANPSANKLYSRLVEDRHSSTDPVRTDLLKKIINHSIGFFGRNELKHSRPKFFLTNKLPFLAQTKTHQLNAALGVREYSDGDLLFVYQRARTTTGNQKINNALHLFLAIIETGKLRLIRFINFLQEFLPPDSFRVCFVNTDSLHVIFSEADWNHLVPEERRDEFLKMKAGFISEKKIGGMFKLEWEAGPGFRYVTAALQNFAVLAPNLQTSKWSGINNVDAETTYAKSCQLLEIAVKIDQDRRTNKALDTQVQTKTFTLAPTFSSV